MIIPEEIVRGATHWSLWRKTLYDPGRIYIASAGAVFRIGSVWSVDRAWIDRIKGERFAPVTDSLRTGRWGEDNPLLIGLGSNGFVTLLDGNHRLSIVLFNDLVPLYPAYPVRFHYFDVGGAINPLAPDRKWDGSNLAFICYPRGTCGKCGPCRRTLPEIVDRLEKYGFNRA